MNQTKTNISKKINYTYNDLVKLETRDIYNSMGKMVISTKQSAPAYGFSKQERNRWGKVFIDQEKAQIEFAGNSSPGPQYNTRGADNMRYSMDPQIKIGKSLRPPIASAKFDYYHRKDVDFEPHDADIQRRTNAPNARIGLETRFSAQQKDSGPGPKYKPNIRPEVKSVPKYSFGMKPEQSSFIPNSQTPSVVGPGCYIKNVQQYPETSMLKNEPKWSFTKGSKFAPDSGNWDKNQTYDTKSVSIGTQVVSRKRTQPSFSIGKSSRDGPQGYFKDLMVKVPQRLNMTHNY